MDLVLDEPDTSDTTVDVDGVAVHVADRLQQMLTSHGIRIAYMKYPHYEGFHVGLRHGGGGC